MDSRIRFYLNDVLIEEGDVDPNTTLLYYARRWRNLTGTKEGCNEGDCGACTMVVVDHDAPGGPTFRAVNSCLVLLPMVHGKRVYTVEALNSDGEPHPVQRALVDELGSQCGYCTPGVIMSMFEACYRDDLDEDWQLDDQMCGNLCRCTGYRPIMDATREIAGLSPDDAFASVLASAEDETTPLAYEHESGRAFYRPTTVDDLADALAKHPDARIVNGGTDLSLEVTKLFRKFDCLVSIEGVDALKRLEDDDESGLHIGTNVRLSDLETLCRDGWPAIERMLRFFGARQIKNRATVGGNLCTASPIGDLAPILIALGAEVTLASADGERSMPLEEFVTGYRETALESGEFLAHVTVPPKPDSARVVAYKVSKRQELDISTIAAGLYVALDDDGTVTDARFSFGGMSARPGARASSAEEAVVGQPWSENTVELAATAIREDFTPIDDHRGSAWYRATVAANFLRGFYEETRKTPQPRLPYRPSGTVPLEVPTR